MSFAVQPLQSSASSSRLQPQASSAPVHDFVCLFTHDLRRKQKRWQDGRLKYHTFNKRVMVYDDRGNFVGDTHWREDYDFGDGEELTLERGAAIVQVAECTGSRDQDLSELLDKRAQEKAKRQSAKASRRPQTAGPPTPNATTPQPQVRHRPLHNVIGTPTGHHGRAVVPTESPYEERQRHAAPALNDSAPPAKRRKRTDSPPSKAGYAQNLFGATLTLSGRPLSQAPVRHRPARPIAIFDQPPPTSSDTSIGDSEDARSGRDKQDSSAALRSRPAAMLPKPVHRIQRPEKLSRQPAQVIDLDSSPESSKPSPPIYSNATGSNAKASDSRLVRKPSSSLAHQPKSPEPALADNRISSSKPSMTSQARQSKDGRRSLADVPLIQVTDKVTNERQRRDPYSDSFERRQESPKICSTNRLPGPKDTTGQQKTGCIGLDSDGVQTRTELRIKPRKRRGLLMVSERGTMGDPLPASKKVRQQANHRSASTSFEQTSQDDVEERRSVSTTLPHAGAVTESSRGQAQQAEVGRQPAHSDQSSSKNKLGERTRQGYEKETTQVEFGLEKPRAQPRRQSSRKKKTLEKDAGDSDDSPGPEDDQTVTEEKSAPRLAKLGRRSVRSKEVIGFIFDDDDDDLAPSTNFLKRSSMLQETSTSSRPDESSANGPSSAADLGKERPSRSPPRSDAGQCQVPPHAHIEREVAAQANPEPAGMDDIREAPRDTKNGGPLPRQISTTSNQSKGEAEERVSGIGGLSNPQPPKQAVRLINPASRGKKAAQPSDAAGQIPICPLPVESGDGSGMRPGPKKALGQKSSGKPKEAPLPGFSRANGGPWSREAHDLFEFQRPS